MAYIMSMSTSIIDIHTAAMSGIPSRRWKPRAIPRNSAISVARIIMKRARKYRVFQSRANLTPSSLEKTYSGIVTPTRPIFPAMYWNSMAMSPESHTIHSSLRPKVEPAAMLEPKLPGSMYATLTMTAGPRASSLANLSLLPIPLASPIFSLI